MPYIQGVASGLGWDGGSGAQRLKDQNIYTNINFMNLIQKSMIQKAAKITNFHKIPNSSYLY